MADIRILIIADNLLARAGLAALLSSQNNFLVVGQVAGDSQLPDDLDIYRPDVLVWDLGWNPKPPIDRVSTLIDESGGGQTLPILVLIPDETHAAEVAALLGIARAGGLLLRDSKPDQLLAALPAVAHGLLVIDPALGSAVLPSGEPVPEAPSEALTPRELDVLQLMAEGLANKAIAQKLGISDHTVKFHVNAIMSKLNAQSRTEAVVRATRQGLIIL